MLHAKNRSGRLRRSRTAMPPATFTPWSCYRFKYPSRIDSIRRPQHTTWLVRLAKRISARRRPSILATEPYSLAFAGHGGERPRIEDDPDPVNVALANGLNSWHGCSSFPVDQ
jgi:hypothetical protein